MMNFRVYFLHVSLSLLFFCSAFAVSTPDQIRGNTDAWTHFTVNNGLPDELIVQVVEDYDGSLIIVTANNGLFRYDGVRFLPLSVNQQLPSLFIQKVVSDKKKRLWISCNYDGIWILDHGRVFPFFDNHVFEKQHFTEIYCDRKGRVWINVNRVGLFVAQGDKCENFTEKYNLPVIDINQIGEDQAGNIYFVLNELEVYQFTFDKKQPLKKMSPSISGVKRFVFAPDSSLWILRTGGVVRKKQGEPFTKILKSNSFELRPASNLFADSHGRIWLSMDDHIYCFNNGKQTSYFFDNIGNANIFEDRFGNLWFSSTNGIYKFINQYPQKYDFPDSENSKINVNIPPHTHFLYRDRKNQLWFTDQQLRLHFFDGKQVSRFALPESLTAAKVTTVCQDQEGVYWFGTYGMGVLNWDGDKFFQKIPKERLPGTYITSIFADSQNRVWIGSISALHHFSSYRLPENKFEYSLQQKEFSEKINITSFTVDSSENVWLGTAENFLFRSKDKDFQRVNSLNVIRSHLWQIQNLTVSGGIVSGNSLKAIFKYDPNHERSELFHPVSLPDALLEIPPEKSFPWFTGDYFFQIQALKKYPAFQIFNLRIPEKSSFLRSLYHSVLS